MASTESGVPKPEETVENTSGNGNGGEKEVVFQAPECPVEKVTVYPDRAEVCRRVEASLSHGLNQVVVKKLPEMVYSDSIRVEGQGAAIITEVMFHTESVPRGVGDISTQEKQLVEEREELKEQQMVLQSELSVLKKQWQLLDGFATTASKGGATATTDMDKATGSLQLTEPFFKGLTDFLQLYSEEGNSLEKRQLEVVKKLTALQKKIDANNANYNKLRMEHDSPDEIRKCIILVECKESCKVSLLVSYVTASASWKPSYDIRMYSAEDMLKIAYYGQIRQLTGEDWVDAKLYLSTALPSVGGEIPELRTVELSIYNPVPKFRGDAYSMADERRTSQSRFRSGRGEKEAMSFRSIPPSLHDDDDDLSFGLPPPPPPPPMPSVVHAETQVGKGGATTMYEIQRRSTVPSDDVEHKVTVGLINIKPKIHHCCIPKLVPHAFMLAKVKNSSPYTFLAGETSIFFGNTFVSKASIKDVYPMEEFDCSLGMDPAVKVTYKPQKKFQASSGIMSKVVTTTHKQVMELKNTHDYPVHVILQDQLPRSTDDRIKVNLIQPQIDVRHPEKSRTKEAVLNKGNNIEWTLDMKAQESLEVLLKYTLEYPAQLKLTRTLLDTKED